MDKKTKLEELAKEISSCKRCPLYQEATKAVPGEGNPEAEIMLIGEAPGFMEDLKGIPFCGAAGNLLNRLLLSIKLEREDVFICNMLRHRPPNNRDPLPFEIEACRLFLDKQIKIIDPKIIVTLGRFSMNKFLPGQYISAVHGQAKSVEFAGKKRLVVPMFHPAAALRRQEIAKAAVEDFENLPKILEENLTKEKKPEEESKKEIQLEIF